MNYRTISRTQKVVVINIFVDQSIKLKLLYKKNAKITDVYETLQLSESKKLELLKNFQSFLFLRDYINNPQNFVVDLKKMEFRIILKNKQPIECSSLKFMFLQQLKNNSNDEILNMAFEKCSSRNKLQRADIKKIFMKFAQKIEMLSTNNILNVITQESERRISQQADNQLQVQMQVNRLRCLKLLPQLQFQQIQIEKDQIKQSASLPVIHQKRKQQMSALLRKQLKKKITDKLKHKSMLQKIHSKIKQIYLQTEVDQYIQNEYKNQSKRILQKYLKNYVSSNVSKLKNKLDSKKKQFIQNLFTQNQKLMESLCNTQQIKHSVKLPIAPGQFFILGSSIQDQKGLDIKNRIITAKRQKRLFLKKLIENEGIKFTIHIINIPENIRKQISIGIMDAHLQTDKKYMFSNNGEFESQKNQGQIDKGFENGESVQFQVTNKEITWQVNGAIRFKIVEQNLMNDQVDWVPVVKLSAMCKIGIYQQ